MRSLAMVVAVLVLAMVVVEGQFYGGGSCDWSQCRYDRYLAQSCCSSSGTCCDFANGGNNNNNNGNNGGFNNKNKPGSCPPYNGRKKRSPRGRFPGNNGNGRFPGNNGYNNGGQGYNPGYNNGYNPGYGNGYNPGYGNGNGYNNNGGSCIRDSECSADLKCCYLRSGYQCTRPNYYG